MPCFLSCLPPVYVILGQAVRAFFPPVLGPLAPGKGNSNADGLRLMKNKCCAWQGWGFYFDCWVLVGVFLVMFNIPSLLGYSEIECCVSTAPGSRCSHCHVLQRSHSLVWWQTESAGIQSHSTSGEMIRRQQNNQCAQDFSLPSESGKVLSPGVWTALTSAK